MYQIDFYADSDGFSEILAFIAQLEASNQVSDRALLGKIRHHLDLLALLGPRLHEPHVKYIRGYTRPLFELRPVPERIFFATWMMDRYVLLTHYTKRQARTDRRLIRKALDNLTDWQYQQGVNR
ncbi:type II toxin-antitoxin system RelE/ParE family toxin [Lacticaseibacillus kribbianus]|uniref:type II toxin-antitoxin system RelE/ParE family toxin n=1 Tax=Lacticaseibacillus kribbianus TaxID=2926292 RepID=UPI001CD7A132|nr:type II toxin-antitoxin system RelE/ParE family toxin [Lacticaseibacillus kribbianus]